MTIAKILLPVGASGAVGPSGDVAFTLAARYGARVEGLYPVLPAIDRIRLADESGAPMQLQKILDAARKQAEQEPIRARKAFTEVAKRYPKVKSAFEAVEGSIDTVIARRGRLADMTVVPAVPKSENEFWVEVREGALFQSGRPVLVAPNDKKVSPKLGETVIVAWKDDIEAARALTAAKPLLAMAKSVRVVTVGKEDYEEKALADVKAYLTALGVKPKSAMIAPNRRSAGQALVEEAAKTPGALLVMGAYSQWRWKEWALGGTTEYVLRNTQVPVLMTH